MGIVGTLPQVITSCDETKTTLERKMAKRSQAVMMVACIIALFAATACLADVGESEDNLLASQPTFVDGAYFLETFADPIEGRWTKSSNSMYGGNTALTQKTPDGPQGIPGDAALVLTEESKRYGIGAPFTTNTVPGKELVFQYELKYAQPLECAGAYLKFLSGEPNLEEIEEKTGYTVMFGPDKCGTTNKIHLILRFQNAKSSEWKEHHLKNPPTMKNDQLPHLYTAVLRPDNSFEIFVDQVSVKSGSLTDDSMWEIPFTPPKEIDDPTDKKPADWVDTEEIPDPEAKKPDDWDEDAPKEIEDADAKKPDDWDESAPEKIPDPAANKPEDWDDDEDGPWEARMVENPKCKAGCGPWKRPVKANPAYKGKWSAPMIKHPGYKGVWKPKRIENPHHYEVTDPVKDLAPIGAVAIEVWVHKPMGILYDNILVGDDFEKAKDFATATWKVRIDEEKRIKKEAEDKAKAEARKKRLAEGGFMVSMEEYTKMAAESFAAYPWISFPALLLFFFLIFKYCRGSRDETPVRRERVKERTASTSDSAAAA